MQKKLLVILLTLLINLSFTSCTSKNSVYPEISNKDNVITADKKDLEEIRKTALDYIEGWYEGDAERMKRALHPDLVKRSTDGTELDNIGYDTMIRNTEKGGGSKIPKNSYEIDVKILDVDNNIATVMTNSQFVDYLHLAKIDGKWLIVNVLWG